MPSSDPFLPTGWLRWVLAAVAGLVSIGFFVPALWSIVSAMRPESEIFRYATPLQWHTLVPLELTVDNFTDLMAGPFPRAVLNSALVAAVTVAVGLLITSFAAFALAALDVPGKGVFFSVIVVALLVPFDVIAVPMSSTFRSLGFTDTYVGLILPGLANALAVFLLRQFFLGIPRELTDAAVVDGASWWQVYRHVYIPLSKPALVGAGLILFLGAWGSYLWPLLITTQTEMMVAPIALARLFGQHATAYGQLFAGALVISVVPIVALLVLRKPFSDTIATTGQKE